MTVNDDVRRAAASLEDVVAYPLRTFDTGGEGVSTSSPVRGLENGSLTRTAQQTIREVLGWRYRGDDVKGFLAALGKAFSPREVDGHVEWDWKAQSYTLNADLGEITGAQASIHRQACVAVEQALPLLDGLEPLRPDVDEEDTEATRALLRSELQSLVDELALSGGPRVLRVDLSFRKVVDLPSTGAGSGKLIDPETVKGQLGSVRERFGLERARVNTVLEEQTYTNFLILVDYVHGLYRSWCDKRPFFARSAGPEPFLGTQLVLLSQALEVIVEQVRETYQAMDSVLFGPAERQVTMLSLAAAPISVGELLGWVESFAAVEGRSLLQDGGKDGVVVFHKTVQELSILVDKAAHQSSTPSKNPVPAFHTKRVEVSLRSLALHLRNANDLASGIQRHTLQPQYVQGPNENALLDTTLPPLPPPQGAVLLSPPERVAPEGELFPERAVKPGESFNVRVSRQDEGRRPALDVDDDLQVEKYSSGRGGEFIATIKVLPEARPGWRGIFVDDGNGLKKEFKGHFQILESFETLDLETKDIGPLRQGERRQFEIKGENLNGATVVADGDIDTGDSSYGNAGLKIFLTAHHDAKLGVRDITVVSARHGQKEVKLGVIEPLVVERFSNEWKIKSTRFTKAKRWTPTGDTFTARLESETQKAVLVDAESGATLFEVVGQPTITVKLEPEKSYFLIEQLPAVVLYTPVKVS